MYLDSHAEHIAEASHRYALVITRTEFRKCKKSAFRCLSHVTNPVFLQACSGCGTPNHASRCVGKFCDRRVELITVMTPRRRTAFQFV
jgi:hypothetical protein